MNSPEKQERLRAAFASSNAINDLAGMPFTEEMKAMQERIISGEIDFDQAIQEVIGKIHTGNYRRL